MHKVERIKIINVSCGQTKSIALRLPPSRVVQLNRPDTPSGPSSDPRGSVEFAQKQSAADFCVFKNLSAYLKGCISSITRSPLASNSPGTAPETFMKLIPGH